MKSQPSKRDSYQRGHRDRTETGRDRERPRRSRSPAGRDDVPKLRHGADGNYAQWKTKITRAALEKYGELALLMKTGKIPLEPQPTAEDYDLENDP